MWLRILIVCLFVTTAQCVVTLESEWKELTYALVKNDINRFTDIINNAPKNGIDVKDLLNFRDKYSSYLIHRVMRDYPLQDPTPFLKVLIDNGADVNKVDDIFDGPPLQYAISKDYLSGIELLLKTPSIDLNRSSRTLRETPLMTAIRLNRFVIAEKLLCQKDIDINKASSLGDTALHLAARENKKDFIKLLIKHGAVIEARDVIGATPLHYAAKNNSLAALQELIDLGAQINAKDRKEETALHYAAQYNFPDVVSLLTKQGADLSVENLNGETPLDLTKSSAVAVLLADQVLTDFGRALMDI